MATASTPAFDIRRANERLRTKISWLDSNHSFSFGRHFDPTNLGFGLLIVSNDDVIQPGSGFMTHPHQDMEIVTWVLEGELEHRDSEGNRGIIYPGLAQRMSAGTGIYHSEMNPRGDKAVRLVQMWVPPDTESIKPGYEQLDINPQLDRGGLVPVATGQGHDSAITIRQEGATLWTGRLGPDELVMLPDAPYVHLFVATGGVDLEGVGPLEQGDAVRITGVSGPRITAGAAGAEVLVWEMHSTMSR